MDSTSALWPCNNTSRLHPRQKHEGTSTKMDVAFESNFENMLGTFQRFSFWPWVFEPLLWQPERHYAAIPSMPSVSLRGGKNETKNEVESYNIHKNKKQTVSILTRRAEQSFSFALMSFCKLSRSFLCSSTVPINSSITFCFSRQSRSGVCSDTRWSKVLHFYYLKVPGSQHKLLTFRAETCFNLI